MSAAWMWVRADLRRRWRSWVVLGLLAGVSMGLFAAGVAGARRAENAIPTFTRLASVPDAAVLANDAAFDDAKRAQVVALPEVRATQPFMVAFLVQADKPGIDSFLLPTEAGATQVVYGLLVAGRAPNPDRADEIVVNEAARTRLHLPLGATITLSQEFPADASPSEIPGGAPARYKIPIRQQLRVVGITKSVGPDLQVVPSSGFYTRYRDQLIGLVNEFVTLRHPEDFTRFQGDMQRIMGHPVNVAPGEDLFGTRQLRTVAGVERNGLLLFALAVLIGAGALVGQALVRAVSAGAADLPTWRAIGADRSVAWKALAAPAVVTAAVGAVVAIPVAIALSPRFPIALVRQFDVDVGVHADWLVLLGAMAGLVALVLAAACVTAVWRVRRDEKAAVRPPFFSRAFALDRISPAMFVGSRLAAPGGSSRRSVPIRSALVGAIAGVLGVVGCVTFRAGLADVVHQPERSGIVWNEAVGTAPIMPDDVVDRISADPAADAVMHATWARALPINGAPIPAFGIAAVKGDMRPVVLAGRAPRGEHEIAFAPTTMKHLGVQIGDEVRVGSQNRPMLVVGRALLPSTSHTEYDQSAWMTAPALMSALPADAATSGDFTEDYVFVRWKHGADVKAAQARFEKLAPGGESPFEAVPATLPSAVSVLGDLRVLPLVLAIFFGLLAIATVGHALVTTVRRRRGDLAVLRSMGLTRGQIRLAVGWQATVLGLAGLVVGIPFGIVTGRWAWKQLASTFPLVYAAPVELVAVAAVVPIALLVVNALAAGPAHAATRVRPAAALRSE